MIRWINLLRESRTLPDEGYRAILESTDRESIDYLHECAREVAVSHFGRGVYIRALVELTNRCKNNCLYCGIRAANREVERYSLTREEIQECCKEGYELGFRTFVFQGGEDPTMSEDWIVAMVGDLRTLYPDCAITLSLGERSRSCYERFFEAGANRYLLRHESHNEEHYSYLHPKAMSLKSRLQCLEWLKQIGFQTGTGIMVGAPGQSVDNIIEDLRFIEGFAPEMIGIGPFVPHHNTPFRGESAGSVDRTLRLISIFRLMHPTSLIPSTTALATLAEDGRERGILAGANVVMPNLSPEQVRANYSLYDNKASLGSESAQGLAKLSERLANIGYTISYERGDFCSGSTR